MKTNVLMVPALAFLTLAVLCGCPMDPGADLSRQEQIEVRWAELEPSATGTYYLATDQPSFEAAPYHAGTLDPAYLADCLNMANFARFLAYLPDDLVMDAVMNDQSQHGALLLRVIDTIERDPLQPAGMSSEDYTLGLTGLDYALLGSGYSSVAHAERQGWLPDTFALTNLGHRRQILNPALQKVGFGHVDGYSVMQSLDESRAGSVDFEYVAWPSREAFPVEFFPAGTAWCVSLNSALYNPPTVDDVTITLTRVSTSHTWILNADDITETPTGEYLHVDSANWGIANCIIFRPDSAAVYAAGETYEVRIAGLSPKAGGVTTVSYEVRFFSLP